MRKKYLILAEGNSADAHYGKTMRGIVRYRPDEVVAILDSTRAGETYEGVPIVGSVADALPYEPDTALVGVAVAGGRLGPEWRTFVRLGRRNVRHPRPSRGASYIRPPCGAAS